MSPFRLPSLPLDPIGYRRDGRPIYPILGGAAAAEDLDDEIDDEEDLEDEDEPPEDDKKSGRYEPPSRAEWLKVQNALLKANASAKLRRETLAERDKLIKELQDKEAAREAEAERKALLDSQQPADVGRKGKKGGGGGPTPAATLPDGVLTKTQVRQLTAQAAREAEERTAARFRDQIVNVAAASALTRAGAQVDNVERLVRLLELDDVQLGEKGEIEGLDDQVEALKAELPQLFRPAEEPKPKPRRAPAPRANPAGRPDPEPERLSSAQQIAAMALGNRV